MDLENQRRVKALAEKYGPENLVVVLGGAEAEASGLTAETVTAGDPTYAGPLAGVQLGLSVWHIVEDEIKAEVDPEVYDEQIGIMEMVLDIDAIKEEVSSIRKQYSIYYPAPIAAIGASRKTRREAQVVRPLAPGVRPPAVGTRAGSDACACAR